MTDELTVRRAGPGDFPRVLALARRALGWTDTDTTFLSWKHLENPFGTSPMWVALDGDRVVGFRSFMRWEFVASDGRVVRAARAVDTATDPDYQGRGIFTRLTTRAVDELPDEGVELVFNTPNGKSLPGYLKMGWQEVGRLPVAVMPTSARFPLVVATARRPAGRWPLTTTVGANPRDVFAPGRGVDELLASLPGPSGLGTRRSREFLAWRYGADGLGYRVMLQGASPDAGLAIFRRRPRGRAVEVVVCDVLAPGGDRSVTRSLVRRTARAAEGDYLIRIAREIATRDPFVRVPRVGPVLACRSLDATAVPGLAAWSLTMGDVELF